MSPTLDLSLSESASSIDAAQWNACGGLQNPFVSHAFFVALEQSRSACAATGWAPVHLVARDQGEIVGIMPLYQKSHSAGEYIFDHGWAEAFERAGGAYYPKLQCAVPFTPAPGPRLLLRDARAAPVLLQAARDICMRHALSSVHVTFVTPEQLPLFRNAGWMIRTGQQFHWSNRGYRDFADFLASLASRKRKMIRHERAEALRADIMIERVQGSDIQPEHWDALWRFYLDTGSRKWGQPYLTRAFFQQIAESMSNQVLLVMARRAGQLVAGAINFIGSDTLYGRYWGCLEDHPFLHFEICYYQAIEFAIGAGLVKVEAGAQGAHKLARGYEPTPTYSAHWIAHPGFRAAVADFLERETAQMADEINYLGTRTPFKQGYAPDQAEDHE